MRGVMASGGARRCAVALAGAVLLVACGASPRMVHQSAYYFERCHAADLDGQRTVDERQACWAAWIRHWSSAQPAVRVRYAERRLAALSRGEAMEPLPFEDQESTDDSAADGPPESAQVLVEASTTGGPPHVELAPGGSEPAAATAPAETDESTETGATETGATEPSATAEAPRDPITPARPGPPPPPVREPPPAPPPRAPIQEGHPCTELCNPRWDICVRRCEGRGSPCIAACRSEYRVCMGACR